MHVLVATSDPGQDPTHSPPIAPLDGELVHLPAGVCRECRGGAPCGWCEDAFTGITTHRPTRTAEVADRDLTTTQVVAAVADSLLDGNLFWGAHDARARAVDLGYSLVVGLLDVAAAHAVGTVLEREHGRLRVRARS